MLAFGLEEFRNGSSSTAVIQRVALAEPHNLTMLAAYAVPITGHDLYGVLSGYPPAKHLEPGVEWSKRQWANGARIPPTKGHDVTNLVLVLRPVGAKGSAKGVDVHYEVAGQQYLLRTATQILVLSGRECPANL